ncbi:MAG TPA: ABC transporter substrate-binding protein, partial [Kofleriaceae bacterium]
MPSRLQIITLVALAGCSGQKRRTPDDTLVVALDGVMTTADPRYTISNYDSKLAKLVYPGLMAVDTQSMEPRLELADKLTQVDPLTWDAEVRPDAKFSDGAPVTAADVAWTYQSMLADKSDSVYHKNFVERFSSVEVISDRVARFHLKTPLATMASDLDFGIVSKTNHGAGPYVVKTLTSTNVLLDPNPYAQQKPLVPHVEIRFVRDASARLLMLVGGSADLIQNGVRLDLVNEVLERPRVHIESAPSVLLTYLMFNNEDKVLKDVRVRKAIALALDRPAIINAQFQGRAVLATGLLPPSHWAYEGNVTRYTRDLPRAKALLDEAGLVDPDGDGPRPRVHFVYKTSSDAFRIAVAKVIVAQLAEVGIDVELRPFEFGTFFADIKKGQYQLASMQSPEITEPDLLYTLFNSARIPDAKNPDGNNRWRYRNARVDELTIA